MQAIELPTREQTDRIKALISNLGGYVRSYRINNLSKKDAEKLLDKLEVIAIYNRLPPDKQKIAYELMEWLEGGTPSHFDSKIK